MKVAAVGYSCMDIYDNLDKFYPTGNGIDFALNIRKKGIASSVVSAVGNDLYGEQMRKKLEENEIDSSHLRTEKGSTAVIHMKLVENDRVHGHSTDGVMANYYLTESDFEFIKQHDYIHTDYFGRVYGLLPEFKKSGCQIIFDFSVFLEDKDIHLIMPHVDYALFSYTEHDQWIEEKMKWAHSQGVKIVVVTFGEKGSLAYDGSYFYKGAITAVEKVVNTVGAGDAFLSGFMAGIMKNLSIPECLKEGANLSADVIQKFEPY